MKAPQRVLCLCLAGVGDTLTFTPFLKRFHAEFPHCKIDVAVMFGASRSLLEKNPSISKVIHIPFLEQGKGKSIQQILKLRKNQYDYTIAAFPSNRLEYNIVQFLIGGVRIGHDYVKSSWLDGHFLKHFRIKENLQTHVVRENWDLLQFFGVDVKKEGPGPLQLFLEESDRTFAKQWLKEQVPSGKKIIGFHAGTSPLKNHIKRRWEPAKFSALAKRLVEEKDAVVLLFGGPEELALKKEIQAGANVENIFLVNDTSLRQSAALIGRCDLMVSNDSSLMHVASAMQTPVVALFAYTFPAWVHPWQVPHKIVRRDLKCSPCFYYSPAPAKCGANLDFACNRENTVDHVWAAIEELEREILF